jgi:predicted nucleic acid-binding protein
MAAAHRNSRTVVNSQRNPPRTRTCAPDQHFDSHMFQPNVTFLVSGTRLVEIAFRFLEQLGTAPNLTTDVQLAAHAVEHGGELHSNDLDFGRFSGLRWRDPLAA